MDNKLIALITNNDDDVYCFRKELIEAFVSNGYKVLISCPYGPKFELMKDVMFMYDNSIIDRRGMNVFNDFKLFIHYYQLLKIKKPDIVLTYTAKPNVYASYASFLLRIPYINNVTGLGSVINKNIIIRIFIMFLFKLAYRNAYCVMFQNENNLNLAIRNKMIKNNYKLIPGSGVALNRFPIQAYPNGGNGIKGEKIIINYIGRVLKDKGIDDYIEVAKIIKNKYSNTEFNVIGFIEPTEKYYINYFDVLEKNNIIIYRGSQKDVRPWIKRSHVIIHPSMYGEGMSNVLLENAASGRPIITTNNSGCYETVEDGKSGYIYHGGDIEELVGKIEKFLKLNNTKRENMGVIGRKLVENKFDRNIVINAYLKEIEKIKK